MALEDYKARGIVLHTIKYGENGLIVYMYTDRLARQTYFLNRTRNGRVRSGRRQAVLQPLSVVDLVGYKPLKGDMHRVREIANAFPTPNILFDIRKSTMALFMAEVLYRVVKEAEPNPLFFDFLAESVRALDLIEEGVANFHLYFLVQLSRYLGFFPSNNYRPDHFFDIKRGEFVLLRPQHALYMEPDQAELLGRLMNLTSDRLGEVRIRRADRIAFLSSLMDFFAYHHDTVYEVRSFRILGEIF